MFRHLQGTQPMARMDPRDFLDGVVLPALYAQLDRVFPEFDWRRRGGKWETGPNLDADRVGYFVGRPGRAFCREKTKHQWAVAGGESCTWTRYVVRAASEPRGQEWLRAVVQLADEIGGIDTSPITRDPVSDEERVKWARMAEERRAETERYRTESDRREQRERARDEADARRFVADALELYRQGEDQSPLHRYLKQRGRDEGKMPGGRWPSGAFFAPTKVMGRSVPTVVVPAIRDGEVVGAQRIFIDRLGKKNPQVVQRGGEATPKATTGRMTGAYAQVGRGLPDRVLVLCEGWEDAVAIHQATGWTVRPCISTSGLQSVTLSESDQAGLDAVIIAGDLDSEKRPKNGRPFRPGQEYARDCADRIRRDYGIKVAVALPAHAFAPDLVTADELPRTGKSVDWENIANTLGDGVVKARMGLSRAAADVREQGPWPWEIAWKEAQAASNPPAPAPPPAPDQAETDAAGDAAFVPDGGSDRSKPQWDKETGHWYCWAWKLEAWVRWDNACGRWLDPFAPVLSPHNLKMAHEYLAAVHAPARIGKDGGGLQLIETGSRCYLYDGTKWVEYGETAMAVIRGEVRRYFAEHCKPKTNRNGEITHYVPANISKSEVESIAAAVIDETRTVLPHEAFQFQFWSKPNIDRDRRIIREHATWQRVVDQPERHGLPAPESVTPIRNGLVNLEAWVKEMRLELLPHTPLFFSTGCVDAELPIQEARAALDAGGLDGLEAYAWSLCPEWRMVLEHAFAADDPECAPGTIRELGKVFGYHLTCSMDHHKANIAWHVGPPKCGKSTILKVNAALMGPSNCVSSSMEDMADSFHFDLWIGKRVAHLPDLAVSGRMDKISLTEILKKLGSAEPMSVNRKHIKGIPNWRSMAKIFIAANQMPPLPDPTMALPRRSIAFAYKNIVKVEDAGLERRIIHPRSLAGVLLWALVGLYRLHAEGITQPKWSASLIEDLREQGSRYPGFIEACLEIDNEDADAWLATEELTRCFAAYSRAEGSAYAPEASRLVAEIRGLLVQHGWVEQARNQRGGRNGYRGLGLSAAGVALLDGQHQGQPAGAAGSPGYGDNAFLPPFA